MTHCIAAIGGGRSAAGTYPPSAVAELHGCNCATAHAQIERLPRVWSWKKALTASINAPPWSLWGE
jgi:hypothetical protein